MNVIFLDLDGVIFTLNMNIKPYDPEDGLENRIKVLSEICHKYNCKVVISSTKKRVIGYYLDNIIPEETNKVEWLPKLFELFKKYDIEIIGTTPTVRIRRGKASNPVEVKELEIKRYLDEHPEVEHFCVIDDDDLVKEPDLEKGDFSSSELNMYREYLIIPLYYSSTDPTKAGLQEYHIEEAGKILEKKRI